MKRPDFISPRDFALLCEKFGEGDGLTEAVERLKTREPLAYILGEWYFRNETYKVTPDVLIPRPETEHIVEKVVSLCPRGGRILDLCTGSGCIAISSLCERKDITAAAVDISEKALAIAKENAVINGVSDRISFVQADVLHGDKIEGKYDVIVSNPPYIRSDVIPGLEPEVQCEPKLALDGGEDGLDFYRAIEKYYMANLNDGGYTVFEIGYDQGLALSGMGYEIFRDYSRNDRVAVKNRSET